MKKNRILLTIVIVCNTTLLPISKNESRTIRKDLYSQYENKGVTYAQLIEPGLTVQQVIDRDLQILIEHKDWLQKKMDAHKSFLVRAVRIFDTLAAMVTGSISFATGLFSYASFDWTQKVWKGDIVVACKDTLFDLQSSWGLLTTQDKIRYNEEKIRDLDEKNPGFKEAAILAPIAGAVSVITGLLCVGSLHSLYTYKGKVAAYVQKVKKRFNRDQAVIRQLKEMKYQLKK